MKVFKITIMLTLNLNYLLLLLSLVASVWPYPFNTLVEKNQEVSWEAWLLVDDQNQNRQVHEGQIPKRRITAKSVFVAPTFSPESLPPCSEGYSSDPMGRCIKIIKLDEDKHLDFLVSKLNDKFGSSLDYETVIEIDDPESQPTRLDIPLGSDYDDYSNDPPQEELDMAIIVTPTTKETDKTKADNSKLDKRNDNIKGDALEEELKRIAKLPPSTIKYDYESTTFTTETEQTQTLIAATETASFDTTIADGDAAVTTDFINTSTDPTTTTIIESTTTDIPTSTELAETTTSTTTPKITTYHPVATTYHPPFHVQQVEGARTNLRSLVKFPQEATAVPRSYPNGNYVRFPDADSKYQQEGSAHHTRDVDLQTGNFFNEIVTLQPSQKVHELVLPPKGGMFSGFERHRNPGGFQPKFFPSREDSGGFLTYRTATTEKHPNRKSPFQLSPKWSLEERHKPIVLRFSRKHFNFDTNKFKNGEFYRSVPMDDLTYLFGYKNGHTSHR